MFFQKIMQDLNLCCKVLATNKKKKKKNRVTTDSQFRRELHKGAIQQ